MHQNIKFLKNPKLKTIKKDFVGVPYKKGRFVGEFNSREKKIASKTKNVISFIKKFIKKEIEIEKTPLPIIKDRSFLNEKRDFLIWLGHASFLIQCNGKKFLTDPCFRSMPIKKRVTPAPFHIRELGTIDYLLVSHGHHDHLDLKTIKYAKNQIKNALLPLKMGRLIKRANSHINYQEAGWYQKYDIKEKDIEIFFLPAHHWHRRNFFDYNRILWGSFLIKCKNKTIFFAGDTGYNVHFKEIKKIFKNIDIAIIPINPPYIITGSHMTHSETITAIKELSPKYIIPMHYGAFNLTKESTSQLLSWFKNLENNESINAKLLIPQIGEKVII
ncbi:MBL fold metallo-hydrolase [Nitrosophilus kaiyonis]|uniref:MBL fold metallo-hydrolase n=1 Tax=Nitrosophilus kaiyonis TaxID=2930200 RepID=UPI002490A46B|nr:MBL fold metallo-hydrolase [Nitrosophilus kaiyonis]